MDIIRILYSPTEVFKKNKEHPNWVISFLVICIFSMLHGWIMSPILAQFSENGLDLTPEEAEQIQGFQLIFKYIMLIISPIILLITLAATASYIFIISLLLNGETKFKTIFSLIVNVYIIKIISQYINASIMFLKGTYLIESPLDLYTIGFNIFFSVENIGKTLYVILSNINIFEIWYVIILTIGISVTYEFSKIKSAAIAFSLWVITLAFSTVTNLLSLQ